MWLDRHDNMSEFDHQVFLSTLTEHPGVYVFSDSKGGILYVGKAHNLKKRVQSYFRTSGQTMKTRLMVSKIAGVEIHLTRSDSEAILLENNLIKSRRPRFNISLRDDKSFPYIRLASGHEFPRFLFYRGSRSGADKYYGPYPNAGAVREMLGHLHKIFRLRQCNDVFFRNRSRPCLQYQIRRCSAPCVGKISQADYVDDLRQAKAMLSGKNDLLLEELTGKMESASQRLDFETAAVYRDRIAMLRRIQEKQYVASDSVDVDVVAVVVESAMVCFGVVSIRQGRNLGTRFNVQTNPLDFSSSRLLEAFLPQNYLDRPVPPEILLSERVENRRSLEQTFALQRKAGVRIKHRCRARRTRWIESARVNTADHLRRFLNEREQIDTQFAALCETLDLEDVPERIECFDISHTRGERTVASCVVFDRAGAVKGDYRRFNIAGIDPGDDYAAMKQVLERRYTHVLENDGKMPDLVIIDGGKGQLGMAETVLEALQISDAVTLMGISKGPGRRAGEEKLHLSGRKSPLIPGRTSPALHLIQRIRDEAHRFAITGHRQRRQKARTTSPLERIEGIGDKRRRRLLHHFGGLRGIRRAGIEDLAAVPGISRALAGRIYGSFHRD